MQTYINNPKKRHMYRNISKFKFFLNRSGTKTRLCASSPACQAPVRNSAERREGHCLHRIYHWSERQGVTKQGQKEMQ